MPPNSFGGGTAGAEEELKMFGLFKNRKNFALVDAAREGELEKIRKLLETGADVNAKNKDGYTALGLASLMSQPKSMEVLFEAGGRSK